MQAQPLSEWTMISQGQHAHNTEPNLMTFLELEILYSPPSNEPQFFRMLDFNIGK